VTIVRGTLISPTDANTWYATQTQSATDGLCAAYNGNTEICVGNIRPRAPEVVELARALRGDPNLIYEYVRNSVDTEFLFGSHKGSLGVIIDHSGTSFDQAQLMVDLLRESGKTASFKYGTLTLDGAQFLAWTGISDAKAACDFLSTGGIPAAVNSCTAGGAISSVTVAHVWIEADIGGTARFFDPSFKPYEHTKGLNTAASGNLREAMGFVSGQVATAAAGSESATGTTGLTQLTSVNQSGLATKLQSYGQGLLDRLKLTDMQGAGLREVIGGRLIIPAERPVGGWLQTKPSNYTVTASWANILDPWRAKIKLYSAVGSGGTTTVYVNANFFADEIYGRRLELVTIPQGDPTDTQTWTPSLLYDGVALAIGAAQPGALHQDVNLEITADHPFAAPATAGGAEGKYGDATVTKLTSIFDAATLVIGWGMTSPELGAQWGREYAFDRPSYVTVDQSISNDGLQTRESGDRTRANIAATWLAQFAWAAEMNAELADSRSVILHTVGIISQDQHFANIPQKPWQPDQLIGADPTGFSIYDETTIVDLETSFGLVSRTSNVAARRAAIHTLAAVAATLEGSVVAQLMDTPDAVSTAARFGWGATPEAGETPTTTQRSVYYMTGADPTARATAASAFSLLTRYDGGTGPVAAYNNVPVIPQDTVDRMRSRLSGTASAYAAQGYDVAASSEASLGPGHRIGSEFAESVYTFTRVGGGPTGTVYKECVAGPNLAFVPPDPQHQNDAIGLDVGLAASSQSAFDCGLPGAMYNDGHYEWSNTVAYDPAYRFTRTATTFARFPTLQRGGALIATKYDPSSADEPVSIANVLTRFGQATKGGGGPTVTLASEYKPNEAAQSLKDRFVDRSSLLGVDLNKGEAGFASPTLASIGSGEFPYRLDRRVVFRGGGIKLLPFYQTESIAPSRRTDGPVSNWDIRAEISNSGYESMGQSRIIAAVPTIVAFVAMQDVWATMPKGAKRDVTGILTAKWWSDRLLFNVVTVLQGGGAQQFIRLIDDSWVPAEGGAAKLQMTGTRTLLRPDLQRQRVMGSTQRDSIVRGWKYSGIGFVLTNPAGDTQAFGYWKAGIGAYQNPNAPNQANYLDVDHGWRLTNWTFPYGVQLTMDYYDPELNSGLAGGQSSIPSRVTSSLGYGLDLPKAISTWTQPAANSATDCGYMSIANAASEITKVVLRPANKRSLTVRPDSSCRPLEIFSPGDQSVPSLRYSFDSLSRVKEAKDAIAIREPLVRGAHKFYIAPGYRSEREDPLGGRYAVEHSRGGRETRTYDELYFATPAPGQAIRPPVITALDGRGRVTERTFPEGDKVKYTYDARDNPASLTKCPKTGCGAGNDLVVSATWDPTWNKPLSVTDAMGRTTTFSYYASGNGKSLIEHAVRPAPNGEASQPTYGFEYNAIGLLTRTTDADLYESINTWDSRGCLTNSRLGPTGLNLWKYFHCNTAGDIIEAWDARGEVLTKVLTEYDAMRRPTKVTAPLGAVTKTAYDKDGRPTEVQKRLLVGATETWQVWRTGYTATGQTAWTQDPSGDVAMFVYDALDRKVKATLPTGDINSWAYDAASQLLEVREGVGIACPAPRAGLACDQARETYSYTANGQKASLKDARNNTTQFVYDVHDRLLRTVFPDGTWEGSATNSGSVDAGLYDAAGNVLKFRTREGTFLASTYDRLDRKLTEKGLWTDGLTSGFSHEAWRMRDGAFVYTPAGRMTSAATDQVTKAWTYDTAGRPASHVATTPAPTATSFTFTYGWDVAGNLTSLVYPGSLTATWTYDALSRMTGVTTTGAVAASATLAYDTLSRRTSVAFGDGSAQAYAYEADDDLSSMAHTFTASPSTNNVTFTWANDRLGRQVSETTSNAAYLYEPPLSTTAYGAANGLNQYPTVAATAYSYRADGALAGDGVFTFFYDEKRNLAISRQGLAAAGNFDQDAFDALGVRWWSYRSAPAASDPHRRELTDGLRPEVVWEQLSSTAEGSSTPVVAGNRYYVLGPNPDERLIWIDATVTPLKARYPHTNRRGDTIAISKDGAAETKFTYGPFGESSDTTAAYPWRFTGQRLNSWTGLYHFKARAYSPALGRFLQPDPIGYGDGINIYAYVANSPFAFADPSGRNGEIRVYNGTDVRITLHIKFIGPAATPTNIELVRKSIESGLSGTAGKYTYSTSVVIVDPGANDTSMTNIIELYSGAVPGGGNGGHSFVSNNFKGQWSMADILDRPITGPGGVETQSLKGKYAAPHEATHLLGLLDRKGVRRRNLMDDSKGNRLEEGQIDQMQNDRDVNNVYNCVEANCSPSKTRPEN
jgi:RHS repeat-associated protein